MTWVQPAFLLLLLLLPALWVWPRRGEARHAVIRAFAFLCLVLALARPVYISEDALAHHVWIVDASLSTRAPVQALLAAENGGATILGGDDLEGERHLLYFGELPSADTTWHGEEWQSVERLSTLSTSPLATALELAALRIPHGCAGSVTLISDGLSTDSHWQRGSEQLSARGIPVHVCDMAAPAASLRVVGFEPEGTLHVGRSQRLAVTVVGPDTSFELQLSTPYGEALTQGDYLLRGGRAQVVFEYEPERAGFIPVELALKVNGAIAASWKTTFAVQDPLRVLYLGDRVAGGAQRLQQLLGAGISLESVEESKVPESLSAYDLVMLDDRPAEKVSERFQSQLVDEVQGRGLGLMVAGGGGSFGPGGYHETPVESVLPVEFVQKEEKKDPSTALAVVIDTSGSMSGNRIRLAKEVTRLAIKRLLPHDKVGIVEFYGAKRWAAPLQSAANAIDIQRALNRLDAGGGTVLFPAIEEAYYGLKNAQTRYKHVLMLTDAGVESGPYEALLRRMSRDGICVSTVLVGPERHSEFLVQLADWGNGRFYNSSDRFNLPEIMLKQPSTSRLPAYRGGSFELEPRGGAGWWGDTDPRSTPAVAGYVESRSRVGAEVLLRTRGEGHPLLASWHHGVGRVTAFMSEPTGKGTEPWSEWSGYGPFMARVLARTAQTDTSPYHFRLIEDGTRLRILAERRRPTERQPWLRQQLGSTEEEVRLRSRADGVYEGVVHRALDEDVRIVAGVAGASAMNALFQVGWSAVSDELQVDPDHALSLSALAQATAGKYSTAVACKPHPALLGGVHREPHGSCAVGCYS